jgi:DNA-binding transcriptional ArsR family regulator
MNHTSLSSAVAAARALGHPARLRTAAALRSGELCVCQITEMLTLAPSTVSAHLKELRQAGLTTERKQGRWVHVTLTDDEHVRGWIDSTLATVAGDRQIAADTALVEELRRLPVEDLCRLGLAEARARQTSHTQRKGASIT